VSSYTRPDHYTRRAKAQGLPARSAFKLEELAKKHRLVRKQGRYLDLGCRPGSWSAWLARRAGTGAVFLGIDREPCDNYVGTFLQCPIEDLSPATVAEHLGGPAQVVLCDMAPNTMGAKDVDHLRQIALAEAALALALLVLDPGGCFVCKVFDGRDAPAFVQSVRAHFATVRRHRPKATRSRSCEFFLVAEGFQPEPA